jgi:hypothetical protein
MTTVTEESIQDALLAYTGGEYPSIRAAATAYGVDRMTLARRLKGGNTRREARVSQQILSPIQEDLLIKWITDLDIAGAPPSFAQVREFAGMISNASGGPPTIGKNWITRFLQRHPTIKSKVGRKIEYLRAQNTSAECLQSFFDHFSAVVTRHSITPTNIWNFDEHGLGMGVCTNQRVIGQSATARSYVKAPENRDWVTIIEACSADGRTIDPFILFKGKDLQSTWFPPDTPLNWKFRCTENAFTTNKVGLDWLRRIFLPQTENNGAARLLLCDNHASHVSVPFMYECFVQNVQLVFMPSHSSHILQPLDVGVFSVLKAFYRVEVTNLSRFSETQPVQKRQFIEYYRKARVKALVPQYIKAGWRGTGLYPFNPRKVLRSSQVIEHTDTTPKTSTATSTTPPRNRHKRGIDLVDTTPKSGRHLQAQALHIFHNTPIERGTRTMISKAAKAIDQLTVRATQQSIEIDQLRSITQNKTTTKRVRVNQDSNKAFSSIVEIKKAQDRAVELQADWDRIDRIKEAQDNSEALEKTDFKSLCIEWHINDVGDAAADRST